MQFFQDAARVLLKGVCMPVVEFFVNVLSTPAILVGLVALDEVLNWLSLKRQT